MLQDSEVSPDVMEEDDVDYDGCSPDLRIPEESSPPRYRMHRHPKMGKAANRAVSTPSPEPERAGKEKSPYNTPQPYEQRRRNWDDEKFDEDPGDYTDDTDVYDPNALR